jgi:hypothetical protein
MMMVSAVISTALNDLAGLFTRKAPVRLTV